ncbi:Hypothetical predicted protein, partial [Olea europaea subsp. europaea]
KNVTALVGIVAGITRMVSKNLEILEALFIPEEGIFLSASAKIFEPKMVFELLRSQKIQSPAVALENRVKTYFRRIPPAIGNCYIP